MSQDIDTRDSFEWMKPAEKYYGKLPKNLDKDMLISIMAYGLNNVVEHAHSLEIDDFPCDATSLMDLLDKWFEHDAVRGVEYGGQTFHYIIQTRELDDFFESVKQRLITVYDLDENA